MVGDTEVVYRCRTCHRFFLTVQSFFNHIDTHTELHPPAKPETELELQKNEDESMTCDSDADGDNGESDSDHHLENGETQSEVQSESEKITETPSTELERIVPLPVRMVTITGAWNVSSPTPLEPSYLNWTESTESESFRHSEARTEDGDGCSHEATICSDEDGYRISTEIEAGTLSLTGQEDDLNVFAGEQSQSQSNVEGVSPEENCVGVTTPPSNFGHNSNTHIENCSTNSTPVTAVTSQMDVHRRERRPSVEYLFERVKIDPRNRKSRRKGQSKAPAPEVPVVLLNPTDIKSEVKNFSTVVQDSGCVDLPLDDSGPKARIKPKEELTGTRNSKARNSLRELKVVLTRTTDPIVVAKKEKNNQEHEELNLKSGTTSNGTDSPFASCSMSNDLDPDDQPPDIKRIKVEPKRKGRSVSRRSYGRRKVTECAFCGILLGQPVDPSTLKEGTTEIPVSCTECRTTFDDLKIHVVNSYHEKRFRCSKCRRIFQSRGTLIEHFHAHTKIPTWKSLTPKLEKNSDESNAPSKTPSLPKVVPKLEGARRSSAGHSQAETNAGTSDTRASSSSKGRFPDTPEINRILRERDPFIREKMLLQQKAFRRGVSEHLNELEKERQARKASALTGSRKTRNSERSRTTTSL